MPRIGAIGDMSYGVRQFLLTDPGGNIIRIGQPLAETDAAASDDPSLASSVRWQRRACSCTRRWILRPRRG